MQRPSRNAHARRTRNAFTLLEVMIVLVIIGVLGGIVALNLVGAAEKAKIGSTQTSLKTIAGAMGLYYTTYNSYPDSMDTLSRHNMVTKLVDSWDRPIELMAPSPDGFSFEVRSMGPDAQWDTEDDIVQYPENEIAQN